MYEEIRGLGSIGRTSEYIGPVLAGRLIELRDGLEDEGDSLSLESVLALVQFLRDNPNVLNPSLVATVNGNVRAEWHHDTTVYLNVEFVSDDVAHIVLADDRGNKDRLSVTTRVDLILDLLHICDIDEWFLRREETADEQS